MSDAVTKVRELTDKRDKARVALTRLQTQREAAQEKRDEAIKALKEEFGVGPEKAPELLGELAAKRDGLIAKAEEALSKVNL